MTKKRFIVAFMCGIFPILQGLEKKEPSLSLTQQLFNMNKSQRQEFIKAHHNNGKILQEIEEHCVQPEQYDAICSFSNQWTRTPTLLGETCKSGYVYRFNLPFEFLGMRWANRTLYIISEHVTNFKFAQDPIHNFHVVSIEGGVHLCKKTYASILCLAGLSCWTFWKWYTYAKSRS